MSNRQSVSVSERISHQSCFATRLRRQLAILAATPAPLRPVAEVDALRCAMSASGYRNVYASGPGWVAKVKEHGRLFLIPGSRQANPQQAAAFVVAYYQMRFGGSWRKALANRKRTSWRVGRVRGGEWRLVVWIGGEKHRWEHLFPTRAEAAQFVREHLGEASGCAPLWRRGESRRFRKREYDNAP